MFRRGGRALGWLVTTAIVALVVGGVAAAGGFEPAAPQPPTARPGELVELTRWDVTVQDCHTLPPDDYRTARVQVLWEVTNTWNETQYGFNSQMIRINLPNGEAFGWEAELFRFEDRERHGDFDPGFTRPAILTMDLAGERWPGDDPIRILLGTELQRGGFVIGGSWALDEPVAVIEIQCPLVAE